MTLLSILQQPTYHPPSFPTEENEAQNSCILVLPIPAAQVCQNQFWHQNRSNQLFCPELAGRTSSGCCPEPVLEPELKLSAVLSRTGRQNQFWQLPRTSSGTRTEANSWSVQNWQAKPVLAAAQNQHSSQKTDMAGHTVCSYITDTTRDPLKACKKTPYLLPKLYKEQSKNIYLQTSNSQERPKYPHLSEDTVRIESGTHEVGSWRRSPPRPSPDLQIFGDYGHTKSDKQYRPGPCT